MYTPTQMLAGIESTSLGAREKKCTSPENVLVDVTLRIIPDFKKFEIIDQSAN